VGEDSKDAEKNNVNKVKPKEFCRLGEGQGCREEQCEQGKEQGEDGLFKDKVK
jgi:hypothetical protein